VRAQTAPVPPAPAPAIASATAAAPPDAQLQGNVRRLSIDEAVAMALEQTVDLQVDRLDPQVADYAVSVARSNWVPAFYSNVLTRKQTNPPTDVFGGDTTSVTDQRLTSQVGLQQFLPFGGASYNVNWNSGRITTNNVFSSF